MEQRQVQTQRQTQTQTQIQVQQQKQVLNLSPVQIQAQKLMQLSTDALLQEIDKKMLEVPWLERSTVVESGTTNDSEDSSFDYDSEGDVSDYQFGADAERESENERFDEDSEEENPSDQYEPETGKDMSDGRFDDENEDDYPDYQGRQNNGVQETENGEWVDSLTFSEQLKSQMGEYNLTSRQELLLEYLIGSLNDDGFLNIDLRDLVDEMSIYNRIDTTVEEMKDVLAILWQFDPAGIGARNVQECLLLQIRRDQKNPFREKMETVIERYFDDFSKNRWDHIQQHLHLSKEETKLLKKNILRLNPRPGMALGESATLGTEQIIPDFIVYSEEGNITVEMNDSEIPNLTISSDVDEEMDNPFVRNLVEDGRNFVEALKLRRENMVRVMEAIVDMQRPIFLSGDEALLRPMTLDDVALRTNLDRSTVSRVCQSKYVRTEFGTHTLRWFFSQKAMQNGEEVSVRKVLVELRDIVDHEDKNNPYSDEQLTVLLKEKGFDIARRTIAKYREKTGVPVARLRKTR